jgi:hypothetical protein
MAATVRKAASGRDPRIAMLLCVAMAATRMRSRCGIFRSAAGLESECGAESEPAAARAGSILFQARFVRRAVFK